LGLAAEIRRRSGLPVEFGGGIRSVSAIRKALDAGLDRVILGTAVFTGRDFLAQAVACGTGYIIVSVDVRGGKVAILGWNQESIHEAADIPDFLAGRGVREAVYTDVERDGTLSGIDAERVRLALAGYRALGLRIQYAGGIGGVPDIRALAGLKGGAPDAVVVGKALYEGKLTVGEAMGAAGGSKG
jgi:phosphoribosylformimino-5-aminoimidazole carboxamide ribonucleotide (ProFAR) isomerase